MVLISRYALTEQKRELQLLKEMVRSVRVGGAGTGRGLGDQLEDDEVMVLIVMMIVTVMVVEMTVMVVVMIVMVTVVTLPGDAVGGDAAPGAGDEVGRHDLHPGRGAAGEGEARPGPGGGDHSDSVPGHDQAQPPGVRLSRSHCQRAHGKRTRETVMITLNIVTTVILFSCSGGRPGCRRWRRGR